ncbi:MAG: D-alanine--D-alanine ligase A [Acidobacteria bacterium]|nr:MAG: D-alanine--D-alanine ligase A [Acidobacteriota bacterium]
MKKIRVGVIFGGRSGEHEVSLRSAESILKSIDRSKYDVVPIGITHEGRWLASKNAIALLPAKDAIQKTLTTGEAIVFPAEPAARGVVDVVAGVLGSAVGMDKDVMKRLLRDAGLPVVDYWTVRQSEIDSFAETRFSGLPYPVFVKPANLGSSVGITKVHGPDELRAALKTAAEYDRKIVVERGVDAREIEISVLGNDDPIASVPGEIIPSREFYDYDAKYVDEDSRLLIPAPLAEEKVKEAQQMSIAAFKCLECSGMARVDLFLEKSSEKLYVNEINTLPGFTTISMYPKLWEASGIPYSELIDRLIALAIDRHAEKNRLKTKY